MKRLLWFLVCTGLIASCAPATNQKALVEQTKEVEVFFVGDTPRGFKLFSEKLEITALEGEVPNKVISELISGELQPLDPDYLNLWDKSNSLNQIVLSGTTGTIDLNLGKLNVGSEGELRAIEQLVWTLTGISPSLTTIRFLVNGEVVESFAGHVDTTADFKRAPDYEVLNPIQITSLQNGEQLKNPVVITGKACTFEANVVWELAKDGEKQMGGFTTAAAACPTRSAWQVELGKLSPGRYLFTAKEFSAEDGSLSAIDTKEFEIK